MNLDNLFSGFGSITLIMTTVPFLIIAVIFLIMGIRSYLKMGAAKRSWQPVPGRVMFSEVQMRRSRSGSGTSTSYYPHVVYEYVVNGNRYQGNKLSVGGDVGIGSYQMVQNRITNNYPPGRQLQVYVNPANPAESALEFGGMRGGLFLVIGVIILVLTIVPFFLFSGGMGLLNNLISSLPIPK